MTRANWTSATAWPDRPPPFHPWKLFFKAYPTKSLSLPLYPTIFSLYPSGLSHSLSPALSSARRTGPAQVLAAPRPGRPRSPGGGAAAIAGVRDRALRRVARVGAPRPAGRAAARGRPVRPAGRGRRRRVRAPGSLRKTVASAVFTWRTCRCLVDKRVVRHGVTSA